MRLGTITPSTTIVLLLIVSRAVPLAVETTRTQVVVGRSPHSLSLVVSYSVDTSLLTNIGWSTMTTVWWSLSPTVVTVVSLSSAPPTLVPEALHVPKPSLYIMLELGVKPFAHFLKACQWQIELPHHPLVVLGHLLKLHENGSHVKLLFDDVTSYDKFLTHRPEAFTAMLPQTNTEAVAHFGHEVILHQVHLQPLVATTTSGFVHVHVRVIVLQ